MVKNGRHTFTLDNAVSKPGGSQIVGEIKPMKSVLSLLECLRWNSGCKECRFDPIIFSSKEEIDYYITKAKEIDAHSILVSGSAANRKGKKKGHI